MLRWLLLRASRSRTLRRLAPRLPPVRRAVRRFMPGEELDAAASAAQTLQERGMPTILTFLGENVEDPGAVEAVVAEYRRALGAIGERGLDVELSVKPTQLGIDVDEGLFREALDGLATATESSGVPLWMDMEDSSYVDRTLEAYHSLRSRYRHVGVCLQAYLHRTPDDLEALLPLDPAIRLVKGAYREPAAVALGDRGAIDQRFLELGQVLLEHRRGSPGTRVAFGTHDQALVEDLRRRARTLELPETALEFQLLYGIRTDLQEQLAREGSAVRVLISYGQAWYPWYVRRLAERPANLLFVVRSLLPRRAGPAGGG